MNINPNMNSINSVSHSDFVRNAQHVGLQKDAVSKTASEDSSVSQQTDNVQISFDGKTEEAKKTDGQSAPASDSKEKKEASSADGAKESQQAETCPNAGESAESGTQEPDFDQGMPGASIGSSSSSSSSSSSAQASGSASVQPPPAMDPAEELKKLQEIQQKHEELQNIWMQMMAARQKHFAAMMAIIMDTQTAIQEIIQTSMQTQAESRDNICRAWCHVLGGGR